MLIIHTAMLASPPPPSLSLSRARARPSVFGLVLDTVVHSSVVSAEGGYRVKKLATESRKEGKGGTQVCATRVGKSGEDPAKIRRQRERKLSLSLVFDEFI